MSYLCSKCNLPMAATGAIVCESCRLQLAKIKPEVTNVQMLDFIKVLEYLELDGHTGIRTRMWKWCEDEITNDHAFNLFLSHEDWEREQMDSQELTDLKLIKDTWSLGDDVLMFVCW